MSRDKDIRRAMLVAKLPPSGPALANLQRLAVTQPVPVLDRPRKRGGRLLQDQYPTHYLPHVGRQVMASGGSVYHALALARTALKKGMRHV